MIEWEYFTDNNEINLWSIDKKKEDIISINYISEDNIIVYYWVEVQ